MANEVEVRDNTDEVGAGRSSAPASPHEADPLRSLRLVKWLTRLFVYPGVTVLIPLDHAVSGLTWQQAISVHLGGYVIATLAIEFAFGQIIKLRKRSAYPGTILAELSHGQRVDAAARHGLGVIQRLMGTRAAFIALGGGNDGLDLVSVSGIGREAAERLLEAGTATVHEAMRTRQPVPFKPVGGTLAETGVSRNERLVFIPVVALREPIGILAVVGRKGSGDVKDRELLGAIGSALGLSLENLRQKEELRDSEERLRTVISSTPIVMFALDREGTFMLAEGKGLDTLGFHSSHVLGRSVFDTCRDMPQVLENVRRALAGEAFATTLEVNGRVLEAWLSPVWDHNDELSGINGVVTDITERKRAEEALRESETKFRTLTETVAAAAFIFQGTRIRYVNSAAEASTGYTRQELLTMNFWEVIHPDFREEARERGLARQRGEQVPPRYELKLLTKGGEERWVDFTAGTIEFDGKPAVLGTCFDISERKRAEEALRESEGKFRTLTETVAAAAFIIQDKRFRYVNSTTEEHTGYSREELLTMNFWEVIHPDFREMVKERGLARQRGEDVPRQYETKLLAKGGEERWVDLTLGAIEFDGKPAVLGTGFDITERRRAEETIKHLAYHDALTDLPNRALFQDRLTIALAQARRKKRMVAVLYLDLDHFKVVNDTVGHGEGDKLLQRVAERLTTLVREGDTVARVGGDEFTLLFPEVAGVEDAAEIAERVLKALQQPWALDGHEFHVTASVGIAMYPNDGEDAESLLQNADTAMYRAKEQGRNNYQLYTPAMNARIVERLALENSLRSGLERGEFVVYYQPQVNIRTGQVVGVEALLRWQHPERGLVLPAEFIPVAEETGLILPLGEWVLRTACAQNKAWQEAGLPPIRVAVNLSARQFLQRNLIDVVAQALQETGLDPHWLALEITEGVAMQDLDFTIAMLRGLREMGIQIAIDDFGTGYSSLSYLKRFPIDAVKIDRSFVCDLTVDPNDAAIATTVITMAHNLKLNVIAEGVETEEQLAFLKQRRCDEMQGFLFSKAVPAEAFEKIARTDRRRGRARARVPARPA